jgi:hypothetical protein
MQGAYELAKRVKEQLKDIPRPKDKYLYDVQGIIVEHFLNLIDINLNTMEELNQMEMSEQAKELV